MKRRFSADWPEANGPDIESAELAHRELFAAGIVAENSGKHQVAMELYKRAYLWALQADAGQKDKNTRNKGQTKVAEKREYFLTRVAGDVPTTNAKLIAERAMENSFIGQARELWPNLSDGEVQDKIIRLARRMTAKNLLKS